MDAEANTDATTEGSKIALRERCSGELKTQQTNLVEDKNRDKLGKAVAGHVLEYSK